MTHSIKFFVPPNQAVKFIYPSFWRNVVRLFRVYMVQLINFEGNSMNHFFIIISISSFFDILKLQSL